MSERLREFYFTEKYFHSKKKKMENFQKNLIVQVFFDRIQKQKNGNSGLISRILVTNMAFRVWIFSICRLFA